MQRPAEDFPPNDPLGLRVPLRASEVRSFRRLLGVTQETFAQLLLVTSRTVTTWESKRGELKIPRAVLVLLRVHMLSVRLRGQDAIDEILLGLEAETDSGDNCVEIVRILAIHCGAAVGQE